MDIMQEYSNTRNELKKRLSELKKELKRLQNPLNIVEMEVDEYCVKIEELERRIIFINGCISNLNYSIEWQRTGHQPGSKQLDNRKAAEKYK